MHPSAEHEEKQMGESIDSVLVVNHGAGSGPFGATTDTNRGDSVSLAA